MKGPHWPLDRVKQLAREGRLFLQRTRALDFFPTRQEAFRVVVEIIGALEVSMFAYTQKLTFDTADVYAVRIEGAGWYLKLYIDEEDPELTIISFHPLERPLKTRGGEVKP